jgi:hypothetical protein
VCPDDSETDKPGKGGVTIELEYLGGLAATFFASLAVNFLIVSDA